MMIRVSSFLSLAVALFVVSSWSSWSSSSKGVSAIQLHDLPHTHPNSNAHLKAVKTLTLSSHLQHQAKSKAVLTDEGDEPRFEFHPLFKSNMVIQRGVVNKIWGRAEAGLKLQLQLNQSPAMTVESDESEVWEVSLPAQSASTSPSTLTLSVLERKKRKIHPHPHPPHHPHPHPHPHPHDRVVLTNILFGDVFLCAGQSNMAMEVSATDSLEQAQLIAATAPNLRFMVVPSISWNAANEFYSTSETMKWRVATPEVVSYKEVGTQEGGPSAICFYTLANLYKSQHGQIPIGFLCLTGSGSRIEEWMDPQTCDSCPQPEAALHVQSIKSGIWNGGFKVVLEHVQLKAMLWYQGETNVYGPAAGYACRFQAFISRDIRGHSIVGSSLPVFFVLLHPFRDIGDGTFTARIREAQLSAISLDHVYMTSAIDQGGIGPSDEIHPRNKAEVGRRLSLNLRHHLYSDGVNPDGPVVETILWSASSFTVKFKQTDKLLQKGCSKCVTCCKESPFQMCPSTSSSPRQCTRVPIKLIDDNVVHLTLPTTNTKTTLRFMYEDTPQCSLYNGDGLPSVPFQANLSPPPYPKPVVAALPTPAK